LAVLGRQDEARRAVLPQRVRAGAGVVSECVRVCAKASLMAGRGSRVGPGQVLP
jgi:hypothetical protein